MRRDMDLIRYILIQTESGQPIERDHKEVVYHIALLNDAGLVEAVITNDEVGIPNNARILRLTWQGHEFLDASRNNKIWQAVKQKVLIPGVSWTVSTLLELLKQEVKKQFLPDHDSS